MKNNCTMLVCSCDTYEDTWEPFFKSLKKYWKNFNMDIVLNTESKDYKIEGLNIKTFNLFKDKKVPWGERLIEHLNRIDTEYIFFMLDDFFICENVNEKMINDCFKWMDENNNIAVFSFHRVEDSNNIKSDKYNNFELRPRNGEYRLNCQAAIWRRKDLIKYIKKNESPWDFEIYGSIRSRKYKEEFYTLCPGVKEPINYNMVEDGTGIVRGKWVESIVVPLFKEIDVKIDFSKRGFNTGKLVDKKRTLKDKFICKYKKMVAYIESIL